MSKLLFTGGRIVAADSSFEADVLVEDEKVVAVGHGSGRFVERSFTAPDLAVRA